MTIRTHRIKINIDYEGEPMDVLSIDMMLREQADVLARRLRDRHEGADSIFTAGLHHDIDTHEET